MGYEFVDKSYAHIQAKLNKIFCSMNVFYVQSRNVHGCFAVVLSHIYLYIGLSILSIYSLSFYLSILTAL